MRPWLALASSVLLVLPLACQRLPSDDDGSSGNDGSSNDDTTGFATLLPPDDESGAADEETGAQAGCDPVDQVGCPAGEKCTAIVSGGEVLYACAPDTGGLDPQAPCTASPSDGVDGCPAGTACIEDEGGSGLCVGLCQADADCEQGQCSAAQPTNIPFCADDCSPFDAPCPAPLACRRNGDRFSCLFLGTGDTGGAGSPCGITNDAGCAPGFVCLPGALIPECAADNCCSPVCDAADADTCPAPSTCSPILQGPAPGFENIGACFVPA